MNLLNCIICALCVMGIIFGFLLCAMFLFRCLDDIFDYKRTTFSIIRGFIGLLCLITAIVWVASNVSAFAKKHETPASAEISK